MTFYITLLHIESETGKGIFWEKKKNTIQVDLVIELLEVPVNFQNVSPIVLFLISNFISYIFCLSIFRFTCTIAIWTASSKRLDNEILTLELMYHQCDQTLLW